MKHGDGTAKRSLIGATAVAAMALVLAVPASWGQDNSGQGQNQAPANGQAAQDIPDAPSAVQPPTPKLPQPTQRAAGPGQQTPAPMPLEPGQSSSTDTNQPDTEKDTDKPAPPPPMPPVETVPPGSVPPGDQPKDQENPYKIVVPVNRIEIPVTVKDKQGRRVEGLIAKDFVVKENGVPQKLTFFTSDPFALSIAIVLDTGLPDVTLQKINETYSALVASFTPYDEFALYTYSSTVTQLTDFTHHSDRLTAALDELKLVRGRNNGPPVLGGPLANQPPMVNGLPVGGPNAVPVNTPPIESHVLNDAILRAALDLIKRDRERDKKDTTWRKVIFVISDGQERGSTAGYKEVMRLLQTFGIQVKAVVVGQSALPGYRQADKVHHLLWQGYSNILPKYTNATGGGEPYTELSRNSIEDAYNSITSDARNMYTLGWNAAAVKGSSAYRTIEVLVDKRGLNIYTKQGYYPLPSAPRSGSSNTPSKPPS